MKLMRLVKTALIFHRAVDVNIHTYYFYNHNFNQNIFRLSLELTLILSNISQIFCNLPQNPLNRQLWFIQAR